MGALLAACSATQIGMMRVCLQNNLKNCVADLADGNRSQIVRATEIKERTLDAWLSGTFLPELPNLLTFCYKLRIPVLRFLAETPREADEDWEQARKIASEYASRRKRRRRADVRQTLGQAASLTEIAAEFDYQSIDSLRHHDSDACSTLFRREPRPEMKRAIGPVEREELNRKISNRLEAALKMHPPRSVRSLAIELGFSDSTSLRCRFPDLCNCLVTAAVRFREERRAQIAACLEAALLENPPPTLKAFAKRLPRKDIQSLRLWFPGLCRQLIDRWQENRAMRIRTAGTALEAAAEAKAPESGEHIAKRVGVAPSSLATLFPEAWRNLNARLILAKRQAFSEKCEALRREVRAVATELCQRGIYPARRLVTSLVVESDYKSEDVISTETRRVMSELGFIGLAHRNPRAAREYHLPK
jgi:hypothetical protein